MKIFEFEALNQAGKKMVGTVRAYTLSDAKEKIHRQGFYLTAIRIHTPSPSSGDNPSLLEGLRSFIFGMIRAGENKVQL